MQNKIKLFLTLMGLASIFAIFTFFNSFTKNHPKVTVGSLKSNLSFALDGIPTFKIPTQTGTDF